MPIYAYRCESCGFAQDMLRKMSDPPLSICPECGKDAFRKQVTAAGFQLKGSGWYVTDFRNNGSAPAKGAKTGGDSSAQDGGSGGKDAAPAASGSGGNGEGGKASGDSGAAAPAAAPAAATPSSSSGGTPSSGGTTSS